MLSRYFAMHLSSCLPRTLLAARPCILPHPLPPVKPPPACHFRLLSGSSPASRIEKDAHRRPRSPSAAPGGDEGTRTPDLCLAKAPLSRLSYIPRLLPHPCGPGKTRTSDLTLIRRAL